ncbi:MFS transporter [Amycolatopsis acidicola]|uniref:MFS transporter n=1 Tax=Amycolatopsis acidicola TaxID=2596893 RepID=A0A5N0VAD2_9PSEU|nr:MFS transporter [Amycolatopsis acidicola]KAA9163326.1 MFS transporter [Amycolatopsis acidicola]
MTTTNQGAGGIVARSAGIGARIERLPVAPFRAQARVFLVVLYFFAFYDVSSMSVALPSVVREFGLTTAQAALPATLNLIGYIVGAYVFGSIADYLGRRRAMIGALGLLTVGGLLCGFATGITTLSAYRFVVGIAVGALIALLSTYVSETTPANARGRFTMINAFYGNIGLASTPWIGLAFIGAPAVGWRLLLGFGGIAGLVAVFARWLPESPRWLVLHGREAEADRVVSEMERFAEQRTGRPLPPPGPGRAEVRTGRFPTLALLRKPYVQRMLIVLVFWIAWYISNYAVLGFAPTLLHSLGLSAATTLLFSGIGSIGYPLGSLAAAQVIERFHRKWVITGFLGVFVLGMLLQAVSHHPATIIIGTFLVSMGIGGGSGSAYTYTSEIFPTSVRASANSIGVGIGHIGGAIAPVITLSALSAWGSSGTYGLMAGITAVAAAAIVIGGLRTTGIALNTVSGAPAGEPAEQVVREP